MDRNCGQPLAYFLTYRTYGTWLRGDVRGWNARRGASIRSTPGLPNPMLNAADHHRRAGPAFRLSLAARRVVRQALQDECGFRGWKLLAESVDDEHTHAVVESEKEPEEVLNAFKIRATRRLREAGLAGKEQRIWARHGNIRRLWNTRSVRNVVAYVVKQRPNDPNPDHAGAPTTREGPLERGGPTQ